MALRGIKVLELAGLAPVPFCGLLLADAGARVIKIDRLKSDNALEDTSFIRGKESVSLDLKDEVHRKVFKTISSTADVLIDPYRPGVMERLSLGPNELLKQNPRLIFARLTGYGQSESSMRLRAGHDINYLATAGILDDLRKGQNPPNPPINLLGDFGGGSMMCAFGILMALLDRERTGNGQVVDCSITHGSSYISSFLWLSRKMPIWSDTPGSGLLDGGAHNYRCYRTKDDKYVAVGALEPQFYFNLLKGLGLTYEEAPLGGSEDENLHEKFEKIFLTKTRDEWTSIFENTDSCVTPVLRREEAHLSDLSKASSLFLANDDGSVFPSPALKLSSHDSNNISTKAPERGEHTLSILKEHNIEKSDIEYVMKPHAKL